MKQILSMVTLASICLLGLPSCSSNPNSGSRSTATTSANIPQTAIKVASSSSAVDLLQVLKTAYNSTATPHPINLLEPSQSENIIAGIKQGLVDLGALSRLLKPTENDGTLTFRELVHDALLVASHPSVTGVKNLTTTDLKGIYSGSITNWKQLGGPDATIVVLDRPEDESAKRLLRKHYLGKGLQNAPNAVVLRKEGELIEAVQSTPYSMGAFSLANAISHQLPVNRLSLNGIAPTPANVKTGQYRMVRTIGLIWRKNTSEATQSFISFMTSPAGMKALEQSGFVAVSPTLSANQ